MKNIEYEFICKIFIILIFTYILYYEIQIKEKIIQNLNKKPISSQNIYNLKINHLAIPFGIGIKHNSFSFLSNEIGPFKAYILLNGKIIQSKKILLKESHSFYFPKPLSYNKVYKFIVEGSTTKNELIFETAKELKAPFIKPKNKKIFSPIFIKDFNINNINKKIKKARLYITGLGLYQAFINNNKVGNAYLTPGFNDYDYYLRYQIYDITGLITDKNMIEVHMGDGWYKGRFGMTKEHQYNIFGDEYKLCLNIYIEFQDKEIFNIISDESWKVKSSKQVKNSIYDGEEVDYTLPDQPLEDVVITKEKYKLIPDFGALIVEKEILHPKLYISPKGEQILDFNQNMVGFVRFKGFLNKNQEIIMNHGEVLQNKCFYNENYESAKAILKYKGDGKKRIYEPKFTFFGFRYVLVEGLNRININDFEGVVIYSNLEKTIECKTDNFKINKLIENTLWGQKGNFLDVPTDCPQRDGRLGWTGDSQVFLNTACFNMDSYILFKKHMIDLRGDQIMYYYGDIPAYSPSLKMQINNGGAVWADAATIIPWNFYMNYGDKYLLSYFYPMMKDYVEVLIKRSFDQGNQNLILFGFTYGDWLAQDSDDNLSSFGETDNGFIMSVYYYHSVELISLAAKELGKQNDYKIYSELKNNIYKSILDTFFTNDGKLNLEKDTQTSYVLCLRYNIYKNKEIIIRNFKKRLEKDHYHIKAGFTGAPLILLALFDNDMDDIAYRILYNEDFPGWFYEINLGATTIWERWNSILKNGTISTSSMNSLNHYAYGSVCEAIYSRIVGIINLEPGWKKVRIKPHLNYRMKSIKFSYESISGKYEILWNWDDDKLNLTITIPFGCEAEIILPDRNNHNVKEGSYNYKIKLNKTILNPFSIDTPLIDIMKNSQGKKIINNILPKIYGFVKNNKYKSYSIKMLMNKYNYSSESESIKRCNGELSNIKP